MRSHIDRIGSATLFEAPFQHIYVQNIFDEDIYESIINGLPDDSRYKSLAGNPRNFYDIDSWKMRHLFNSEELSLTICKKFSCFGGTDRAVLVRDRKGFSISPHTDCVTKLITAIFYLPSDDSLQDCGTEFYSKHGEIKKKFPFKRNSMLAFKVGTNSFHGLKKFNGKRRDLLLYYISK